MKAASFSIGWRLGVRAGERKSSDGRQTLLTYFIIFNCVRELASSVQIPAKLSASIHPN